MAVRVLILLASAMLAPLVAVAQPSGQPTRRDVETLVARAVPPLHACLQRSGVGPSGQSVTITVEFDPAGGFPILHEIGAPGGSAAERCVGEAMAELTSPAYSAPALSVECVLPLGPRRPVSCRPARQEAPPAPPPPPPPPPAPTPRASPPPAAPPAASSGPLTREEVRDAMQAIRPHILACGRTASPPPRVQLRMRIDGRGRVTLVATTPTPPPAIEECFREALARGSLRATGQEAFTVAYPFDFN